MHGQQYKTYLGWKKVGRQVRKGEHGEKDHLGETVFGFDQTDPICSRREEEREARQYKNNFNRRRYIGDIESQPWSIADEIYDADHY